jgi:hypothetical protein
MIEAIMYFGIGFLVAAVIGVAAAPLIHDRAVRLTMRRLENSIPQTMAEIQADKDLLRAEFAMSTRRLEIGVEQLKQQNTNHLAELGRKADLINRLKIEREAQNVDTFALKTEVESLKEQLASLDRQTRATEFQRHEPDVVSLVPKDWPRAEPKRMPANSATLNEPRQQGYVFTLEDPTNENASLAGLARVPDSRPSPDDQRGKADQHEHPIHVSTDDQIAHESLAAGRTARNIRRAFIVALIGAGATVAWRLYSDDAREMLTSWNSPRGEMLSVSADRAPSAPAASAEVRQQLDALTRDLADMRSNVEQFAAKQEETSQKIATPPAAEQENKQKLSSAEPQNPPALTPYPETKPTTIAGWALLEVVDGTAVVQGPNGVWRVTRGDTVPGVGRVDSIVRWGNRWIVATSSGLISAP